MTNDTYQISVDKIASLVASLDDTVREDISTHARYLADCARQYKNSTILLQEDIQAARPDDDLREYFTDINRAAGLMSKPIKPLPEDYMSAIIEALDTPQKGCTCENGFNTQCSLHGKHL